ncbi:MAG: [protein-PII] uridylyltransferase [Betaproteobacteria bacterium]|nr:[protein-PII] uridylyltransferase [Betaproteobacteria bacterium]
MAPPAAVKPSPSVPLWKQVLKEGREGLRKGFMLGSPVSFVLAQHRQLVDSLLKTIWRSLDLPADMALVAVGGYGRGELFPYSDIDVLILLPPGGGGRYQRHIEELVGILWDIGLDIGHSVRTVEECIELAAQDVTIQTNLLEARRLAGSRKQYACLQITLNRDLDAKSFFLAKQFEQRQRYNRSNDTAYNLEPNLKECPGGLRDLQNILWISRAAHLGRSWDDLAAEQLITRDEAREIKRHELFLRSLRVRLHYLAGRREDRLLFDYQNLLAKELGYRESVARRASEQLMQRFYRTANDVRDLNNILLLNLRARILPPPEAAPQPLNERFEARHELLEGCTDDLFEREPTAILEIFLILQQHLELKGIGPATLRALRRACRLIGSAFRRDPRNHALFLAILREPHSVMRVLRLMNQCGVLARYLPEFGRIVGQMQHDLFHVYTVDEHIMKVLRNLRRFTIREFTHEYPLCSRLIADFREPELLYIAALFHDIAKGRGGDHSQLGAVDAQRFCRRHGLSRDATDLIVWLVHDHLVMSSTAQKSDLSDPTVVSSFAARVQTPRRLVALYLLTVADIRGTSPKVWNGWKAKLLEDLFWATQRTLTGDGSAIDVTLTRRKAESRTKLRLYAIGEGAEDALWDKLDTAYFLRHETQEIAWHTRQLFFRPNTRQPVVKARLSPAGEGIQVMIYTRDEKDLFAQICSFFERMNYNIVEAKIYTTRHGYALDSFQVMDVFNRTAHYRDVLSIIEHDLAERLMHKAPLEPPTTGRLSRHLKHFPITPAVGLYPDERGAFHVLSIVAGDRPGLLSRISRILADYGVVVHTAKINTLGERAEDTFLVTGPALREARTTLRLESDLLAALES